jgi:hypothetical protein
MLDPSSLRFTGEANYLNHPAPYYWLLARLGPSLEGHPEGILLHRLFNVAIAAIGLAALMAIGLIARLPRFQLNALIVPLACIPVLAPLAGAINNDNAAFAGGAIATLAAFQLLTTGEPFLAARRARRRPRRIVGEVHRTAAGRRNGCRRVVVADVARALAGAMDCTYRDRRAVGWRPLGRIARAVRQPHAANTRRNRDAQDGGHGHGLG